MSWLSPSRVRCLYGRSSPSGSPSSSSPARPERHLAASPAARGAAYDRQDAAHRCTLRRRELGKQRSFIFSPYASTYSYWGRSPALLRSGCTRSGSHSPRVRWYLPNALYAVLFPEVAAKGDEALHEVAWIARTSWSAVLVVGALLTGLAALVVVPFYGSAFVGAVAVVGVLVPGMATGALASVLSAYLAGIGKPGLATIAATVNLGSNVVICATDPSFDYVGAAVASSISYSCAAVLLTYYFVRETGLRLSAVIVPRRPDVFRGLSELRGVVSGNGSR